MLSLLSNWPDITADKIGIYSVSNAANKCSIYRICMIMKDLLISLSGMIIRVVLAQASNVT